ncbi:MAG: hypothetical protein AAFQ36_14090 [Pseudomonadota bacterium]
MSDKIGILDEGIHSVPWRLADYELQGCLSPAQQRQIEQCFGLSQEHVELLSLCVGNALDVETEPGWLMVSRDKAQKHARRALSAMAHKASKLQKTFSELREMAEPLGTAFDPDDVEEERVEALKANLATLEAQMTRTIAGVEALSQSDGIFVMKPDYPQKTRDRRRYHVVFQCCYVWKTAGRQVTYTTRPEEESGRQRSGQLVDLIQMVTRFMTTPSEELPVETIIKDIKLFNDNPENKPRSWLPIEG